MLFPLDKYLYEKYLEFLIPPIELALKLKHGINLTLIWVALGFLHIL